MEALYWLERVSLVEGSEGLTGTAATTATAA